MLISRIFTSVVLKCQNRFVLNNSRCFLSSAASSDKKSNQDTIHEPDSISTKKSTDDNNEWLWAYLRDRISFSDLIEEQRRRVIEIGEMVEF
jgi:hypothetical protein